VQTAAGVRKHRQAVEFFFGEVFIAAKAIVLIPVSLGLGLYVPGLVLFVHGFRNRHSLTIKPASGNAGYWFNGKFVTCGIAYNRSYSINSGMRPV
jgi:hypothetical protein